MSPGVQAAAAMVVIIVTMKMEETKPIYCSIRGLDRLNAVDPARYLEVKTKLGLAVAPYPGQVTFVEKTAEEVLRVLTEDLWMTVQSHDQPAQGEESWTLQSNNCYPGAASQEYKQQQAEYQAREKKKMDFYNYREKLKADAKKPLTVAELCEASGLKDYPLVVTEQKRVEWSDYEAFESYYLPQLTMINSYKVDADLFILKTLCKAKWNEKVKQ